MLLFLVYINACVGTLQEGHLFFCFVCVLMEWHDSIVDGCDCHQATTENRLYTMWLESLTNGRHIQTATLPLEYL